MKLGIVGLPNVGKSTLFNALTKAGAQAENYPFCTIEPNVGTVPVPDKRLEKLGDLYQTEKIVPAFVEFVDIAGLVRGASQGEGLGNKFLSHIREVDAIVHVVRCFEEKDVTHVDGELDPARDIETIETELVLADLDAMQRRIEKQQRSMKASKDRKLQQELDLMVKLTAHLDGGAPARTFSSESEVQKWVSSLFLLSSKPLIYAANFSEERITELPEDDTALLSIRKIAESEGAEVVPISAKVEAEIAELSEDEKAVFLEELGFQASGLDRLIQASYRLLGLFSYLTAGKQEVRAWTIPYGTKAPQAAGKIHTDFERGFIRAEIVNYDDLISLGSVNAAKEQGLVRTEGKEYVMQDGDVVNFRFNV